MDNSLIGVINNLQAGLTSTGSSLTFNLPQIAVIGNQSAGKSSVLENIVKKDFLPRGSGIVTRRPLVLQLVRDETAVPDWAEFGHNRGQRFVDFEQVRKEIEKETDRVTGANKGISPWPINLRVYSANTVDLTIVDLPGMTKVPVGDQPENIEDEIRSMLMTFVSNPACLILAVCPANADLATADAIKLAQEVDPQGERTLGVLTKLDLMDQGTDAREMLMNKLIKLKYGWVGVVNRGQKDIMGNKKVASALADEIKFFAEHPAYRQMKHVMGTPYLCTMLNKHLTMHIARNIPALKTQLKDQIRGLTEELSNFDNRFEFDLDDAHWKSKAVIRLSIEFGIHLRSEVLGGDSDRVLPLDRLNTGTELMTIFRSTYSELLLGTDITQEAIMKKEIGFAIENILGIRSGLFTPDKAFDVVVRSQLDKLLEPTHEFLDSVHDLMQSAIEESTKPLKRFPEFAKILKSQAEYIFAQEMETTRERTRTILDYEKCYINSKHEDFVGFSFAEQKANSRVLKRRLPGRTVLNKGYLGLIQGSVKGYKQYFFTLTPDNFTWYSDESEEKRIYILPLDAPLKLKDCQKDFKFVIYSDDDQNIFRNKARLDLQAKSLVSLEFWKKCLSQVGVFVESSTALMEDAPVPVSGSIVSCDDPWLERQIESVWIMVTSYMSITCKRLTDIIPKCIVHSLIKSTVIKMENDLVAELSRMTDLEGLFDIDQNEIEKQNALKKSFDACRTALDQLKYVNENITGHETENSMAKSCNVAAFAQTMEYREEEPMDFGEEDEMKIRTGASNDPSLFAEKLNGMKSDPEEEFHECP